MKLLTQAVIPKKTNASTYVGVKMGRTSADIEHDALAAHALLQAWDKMGEEFAAKGLHGIVAVAVLAELERRADELMQKWLGETK